MEEQAVHKCPEGQNGLQIYEPRPGQWMLQVEWCDVPINCCPYCGERLAAKK